MATAIIERLPVGIGVTDDAGYGQSVLQLVPGDLLVMYTDGVSEALNPEREEYGEDRLCALFADGHAMPAADALARARADVLAFARGAQQSDDITLVVVRREEVSG